MNSVRRSGNREVEGNTKWLLVYRMIMLGGERRQWSDEGGGGK